MKNKKRLFIFITFMALLFISLGVFMVYSSIPTKYKYDVAVGALKEYEMVYDFNKNYLTDKEGKPLLPFTAVGGSPNTPWAVGTQATALSERNPMPYGIHVRWFSVAENQFYEADHVFNQRMLQALGTYQVNDLIPRRNKPFSNSMTITVYAVPGGLINVWITGQSERYLLAQFIAKKVDEPNWLKFSRAVLQLGRGGDMTREEYIQARMNRQGSQMLAKTKEKLEKGTIPDATPWLRLNNQYPWILTVNDEFMLKDYFTRYVNAEQYYTYFKDLQQVKGRPVPYRISFYVENKTKSYKPYRLSLLIDQEEIMRAFEAIKTKDELTRAIKLHVNIDPDMKEIHAYLIGAHTTIELVNIKGQIDNLYR